MNETEEQPLIAGPESVATLAAENAALKNELHIRSATYDIETRLASAGARSPKLLTDRAKATFQMDDRGELTNAAAIVEQLRREFPEQFGVASIDAGAGRNQRTILTRDALNTMTATEIQKLDWAEIKAVLAQG